MDAAFSGGSRYSPCLAEDCEVFRIPPEATDPVCKAAAPWPTTHKWRCELTLKLLPERGTDSRFNRNLAIPLERANARCVVIVVEEKKKKREKKNCGF